ncbi:MAG: hypothetical protein J5717_13980 [Lachnospiraceae bacterium]|nr:hypothetical protein [Lachnospiraceae bacterium]MBO4618445.1 hypothetical protein [Lachnospiraceae bacterium]
MDKNTEKLFIGYLKEADYVVLDSRGNLVDLCENDTFYVLITRKEYLPLLEMKADRLSASDNLAIEYLRSNVLEEEKRVTRGRLWMSNCFENSRIEQYSKALNSDYNALSRWIKKNIPNQNYSDGEMIVKGYISNNLLPYTEKGFFFI